jgi:hypothetical protein
MMSFKNQQKYKINTYEYQYDVGKPSNDIAKNMHGETIISTT